MTDMGHTKPYPIPEAVKSILKIHGDFSFFAISTDLVNKYDIESFEIIDSDNKIMLVAQNGTERTKLENHTQLKVRAPNIAK